ncbi:MAG: FAD-linked oxidase C-terminal domain-containing protein, partial [Pseudomonadota bacterium]
MSAVVADRNRFAATPDNLAAALEALRGRFGDKLSTADAIREQHGRDESYHETMAPDAVVFAGSSDDVSDAVKICAEFGVPIIPFGTGTSLEGHVAALHGGVSIDVSEMNKILRVNADDLDVVVQPGVTRKQLNEYLRDTGLFFPIDPGADASLGGMTATRASGTNAVRYGTMRENVLALEVVLADGRKIRTSKRARKSSAGYDLTRLFVGSEGTLGVLTEVTLKLYGIPEAISAAVCSFESLEGAVNTVIQTIQMGVPVARIELLDEVQMDAVNKYAKLDYPAMPTLFFEFHGTERGVEENAEMCEALAGDNGGIGFKWATKPEDRSRLWEARHNAYYAALALKPGCKGWATDVCVPISRLAECILETKEDIAQSGMIAPLVGHVGDGNLHYSACEPGEADAKTLAKYAQQITAAVHKTVMAFGGSISAEHGVGRLKRD